MDLFEFQEITPGMARAVIFQWVQGLEQGALPLHLRALKSQDIETLRKLSTLDQYAISEERQIEFGDDVPCFED